MDDAIEYGRKHGGSKADQVESALDRLLVEFGCEILKIVPGKVSTEVDASLSFDVQGSINKALHIIDVRHIHRARISFMTLVINSIWETAIQGEGRR